MQFLGDTFLRRGRAPKVSDEAVAYHDPITIVEPFPA